MTPVHANKGGLRYRYYQSWVLNHGHKGMAGTVSRVPAQAIEDAILEALKAENVEADQSGRVELNAKHFLESVERIDVLEGQLVITLDDGSKTQDGTDQATVINTMVIPWTKYPFNRKKEIIGSVTNAVSRHPMRAEVRSRVLKAMAQGRIWMNQLVSQRDISIHDIAQRQGLSDRSVRSALSIALIAPDIVDAAIDGHLPRGITVTQMNDLPFDWKEQKLALGLA